MINTLHLGLSYCCNMKCKHCFVNKNVDNMDINKLKMTLNYLDNNGLFFVIYTFGEPLLSKKFWEISKYIASKNIVQTLMTNGSLINKKNIFKLKENRINNIYISLDSIDELKHDNNRNFKGSYLRAIKSMKLLLENNFNVGIAVTINNSNVEEIDNFVKLAKKLNIKNISFLRQRTNSQLNYLNNEEKYISFYKNYLINYKKINMNLLFHDCTLIQYTKELYEKNLISKNIYEKYIDMNSCHYSTTLSIEPNGDVKHCNLINNKIGNINNAEIESILSKGGCINENISYCTKFSK